MSVVYDAGVLIAADRSDRAIWAEHRVRLELRLLPITTAPVVAKVSRGARQVQLRRFLRGCAVVPFASGDAHAVGELLATARCSDVVDGHVVSVAAAASATILTSDPDDLSRLAVHVAEPVAIVGI